MPSDDELESRLSEFRRRYREQDESEAGTDPGVDDEPNDSASPPEDAASDEPEGEAGEPGPGGTSFDRDQTVPGWLWLSLGCATLVVLTGFSLGFGLWGGYRLLKRQVLVSSPDGVDLAREIMRFEMPGGARSRASVNLMYRFAIVENRTDPPSSLLAVGSFPVGWSGIPEQTFLDHFDRQFERGRLRLNPRETTRQSTRLCGQNVSFERRTGRLRRNGETLPAVLYHACFRRDGETVCLRCVGLGDQAKDRATRLFRSLQCP